MGSAPAHAAPAPLPASRRPRLPAPLPRRPTNHPAQNQHEFSSITLQADLGYTSCLPCLTGGQLLLLRAALLTGARRPLPAGGPCLDWAARPACCPAHAPHRASDPPHTTCCRPAALLLAAAALLALLAPALAQTAKPQLNYAILLSEGPDEPDAKNKTAPWGAYHITITGERRGMWLPP